MSLGGAPAAVADVVDRASADTVTGMTLFSTEALFPFADTEAAAEPHDVSSETSSPKTQPTVAVVDGPNLTHRAYHALIQTDLRDSAGQPRWAVKGFFDLLNKLLEELQPDALIVAFDDRAGSRRRDLYSDYKATRSANPADLITQLEHIIATLEALGVTVVVPDREEADDVLCSVAQWATGHGWRTVIATSDRDSFATINATTEVFRIANSFADSQLYDEATFTSKYEIAPHQYRDYAAIRGDASDNLPGVKGIGEKGAAKLLTALGSGKAIFDDLETNDGAQVVAAAGKAARTRLLAEGAKDAYGRNVLIMSLRGDVYRPATAPGTGPDTGRLPDPARVDGVLTAAGVPAPAARLRWLLTSKQRVA